ncbi:flippase [Streptococcus sp. 10F2]
MRLVKNYLYNLSYQILLILLPIITTPYITRIFSSNDLGIYGFYNSIVTYFLLLAGLGVANYGTRMISQNRNQISSTFWSIYQLQFITSLLSVLFYMVLIIGVPQMHHPVAFLLTINLISRGLDISWLFQGLEDFRRITARNMTVKLLGVISIFLFIRSDTDLYLYVFLLTFFEFVGQLSMWLPARSYIGRFHFDWENVKKHLEPVILLFLPQVAISLYATLNRTMLGALSSTQDVGIYDQALKIVNILLTIVTSLGSVMLPRVSNLLADGDEKAANRLLDMAFKAYNLIIFPLITGMLLINSDFVSFFLGDDFQDARYAIAIMIFRIFFIGWTNIMGIQILIPHNKNREFMISTIIPAFISVGLNLVLIPSLGYIGAAIVSVLTEFLVWVFQLFFTREYIKDLIILSTMIKIIISSILMYGVVSCFQVLTRFKPTINVVLDSLIGLVIYILLILLLKVINLKEIKESLEKKYSNV